MYILNKVCLFDVPISELNMIKLSEESETTSMIELKEHHIHKDQLHSMNFFMLEKRRSKGL